MPDLPLGTYSFYVGIDPGFHGAISMMNAAGTTVRFWDMPVITREKLRQRELDLGGLHDIFHQIKKYPSVVVGVEWPTTRPSEGAERSERFGRQKGILEATLYALGFEYYKLSPQLWKGRLGLPGKDDPGAIKLAYELFTRFYPDYSAEVRGPRGGIKGDRVEAALMAHFLRVRTAAGMATVVDRYGKESDQAWCLALGKRRKKSVMKMP